MTPKLIYASQSPFKREEVETICSSIHFPNGIQRWSGRVVGEFVSFEFRTVDSREILEMDIEEMVKHKAKAAYSQLQVPCIVEHGGLIFADRESENYPGGLTQPMWDSLKARGFISETNSVGRRAIARAVIGYCDGMRVKTFVGNTTGKIASGPRGTREYYWDTIFEPDGDDGKPQELTYAEIAQNLTGVKRKVGLSQSTKAMIAFLQYYLAEGESSLFRYISL